MNIPSFSDFVETLTLEQVKEWTDDIDNSKLKFTIGKVNHEQANQNLNNIAIMNFSLSMGLLRAYHEWLRKELSD